MDMLNYRVVLVLLISIVCFRVEPIAANNTRLDRPNILFAIADDWSFGHAGAYGSGWVRTPGFDRIAKAGILFTRAYTPNAKCAPSRAIILTGRNSWQLKEACNHVCNFPAEFKSYAEVLSENGYFVGYTGKGWGPGIALDLNGKRRLMTGQNFNKRKLKQSVQRISTNDYAGNFSDFLENRPAAKPWCFWFGTTEPHRGYQSGVGVNQAGKKLADIKHVPKFWPDNQTIRNDMLDYAFEVEHYDQHLSRILKLLEAKGELENTLIVATSDHGMPFPRCKGQAYDYSNHIPLAIMWPAGIKNPGRTVTDYISFADLAPTFLEVAGLAWRDSGMQSTAGKSLVNIFRSAKSGQVDSTRDHVLIGKERHDIGRPHDWGYPIRGIVKEDLLYLRNYKTDRWPAGNPETGYLNCDGSPTKTEILNLRNDTAGRHFWQLCFGKRPAEELYDLKRDPDCVNNLIESSEYAQQKKQLKQQMVAELKAQQDPRMLGLGDYFDKVPYVNKAQRNFYERYLRGEKIKAGWVNPSDFQKQ